ncbi:hypothetical protein D187_004086 [Cystobacter fuscus DSM 2262]|uniref:Lipoprotein n=1 Tax=Cystobacter fuscus (strain ATCC 25194 / DSM 2262 / NBRC 100088 / M29) TaxID=1242864 RepID=S9P1I1_CYSF2|nr:hypothetical protein [Cystobacter fuscus]EPX58330.1 hypothetical protein D187_004086 [Cystobacter fuscus DSM 2262]
MKMTRIVALLGAGWLVGCGGVEAPMDEQTDLATREDMLPACNHKQFERIFYAEPAKLTEVGRWECNCDSNTAFQHGGTSLYYTDVNVEFCPVGG